MIETIPSSDLVSHVLNPSSRSQSSRRFLKFVFLQMSDLRLVSSSSEEPYCVIRFSLTDLRDHGAHRGAKRAFLL